jgi:hypothetical protein
VLPVVGVSVWDAKTGAALATLTGRTENVDTEPPELIQRHLVITCGTAFCPFGTDTYRERPETRLLILYKN